MSENKDEITEDRKDESGVGISDDQLPDDLVPSEDNPLAEELPEGEASGDLLTEGKRAERSGGDQGDADSSDPKQAESAQTDDAGSADAEDDSEDQGNG